MASIRLLSTLTCPSCDSEMVYHVRTDVYERDQDRPSGLHVMVTRTAVSIITNLVGNPSPRRQGVALHMRCEDCVAQWEYSLAQHKGKTEVGMNLLPSQEEVPMVPHYDLSRATALINRMEAPALTVLASVLEDVLDASQAWIDSAAPADQAAWVRALDQLAATCPALEATLPPAFVGSAESCRDICEALDLEIVQRLDEIDPRLSDRPNF